MKLSVSLRSQGMTGDQMVARAIAARVAGIDALYVGDHHAVAASYPQNNVILGRILADWHGDIGAVYIVPLWNPVLLAEQIGTLASMTTGRFVFQAALGDGEEQFAAMGARLSDRVARFEEALPLLRELLDGKLVSSHGLGIESARIEPAHSVVFWVAGQSSNAIRRAATMAQGWVAPPGIDDEEAVHLADEYRAACADQDVRPGDVAIRRDVFVGADSGAASSMLEQVIASGYRGFDRSMLIAGDAGEVAARISSLGSAGFTEVVVRQFAPDQSIAIESIERMREVREALG
ncbi:MAG TPA: LLM class flavin-dependent oxidoreductase [Acidimicrobiia bacterium]|nr:LLM class flavin-dependent oxidoreductase [Acidimicrobiia bacterium]